MTFPSFPPGSPKLDYGFMYSKLVRHVTAADALLTSNNVYKAAKELDLAMEAIKAFETVYCAVSTDD